MLVDVVRESVQRVLPERLFTSLFGFYSSCKTVRSIGFDEWARLRRVASSPSGEPVPFHFPGIAHPVYVRPGGTDASVAECSLVRRYHACLQPRMPVSLIIDAGAYAGYTTLFFANQYRQAEIIAMEPDRANFSLAKVNLSGYAPRVRLMNAALWYRTGNIRVVSENRADSTHIAEDGDSEGHHCPAIDLMTLLEQSGQQRINILKCDIEGAEESIFANDPDRWIERTDSILMEIHGPKAHEVVYSAMRRHPFKVFTNRELHVFYRVSPLDAG